MRFAFLFSALALALAIPATAQPNAAADISQASRQLAANWRPFAGPATVATFRAACQGAPQELATLDGSLPSNLNGASLGLVRAPQGFIIVPTSDDPASAFLFPNAQLVFITPGLATIQIVDAAQGRVNLRDAAGVVTQLQLGHAGQHAVMRILRQGMDPLTFVGCVASVAGESALPPSAQP